MKKKKDFLCIFFSSLVMFCLDFIFFVYPLGMDFNSLLSIHYFIYLSIFSFFVNILVIVLLKFF